MRGTGTGRISPGSLAKSQTALQCADTAPGPARFAPAGCRMSTTPRVTLPLWVDRLLSWFVEASLDAAELRKRKILVGLTLAILSWTPLYAGFYYSVLPP